MTLGQVEKAARREQHVAVAVVQLHTEGQSGPHYLLVKRPEGGLLAGQQAPAMALTYVRVRSSLQTCTLDCQSANPAQVTNALDVNTVETKCTQPKEQRHGVIACQLCPQVTIQ